MDYGQKHRLEVAAAKHIARVLGLPHLVMPLRLKPFSAFGPAR